MKYIGIIPARYASTRFPGKPLAMLGGKPVIQRVYEQVKKVLDEAYVATDDERIFDAVEAFGGKVVMTSPNHKSGTDRIEEAVQKIGGDYDVVVNIQGDEPFIQQSQIETVCRCFEDADTQIATLGKPFTAEQPLSALENPTQQPQGGGGQPHACPVFQPQRGSLSAWGGTRAVALAPHFLQAHRPLCLPHRGTA